ncbi:Uncharacterised protein [Vibrio cholerae]|uniref:Uncharacterized protein n=1 Tax=Vibrio cholerae TaxID=666 RepID=A0A655VC48_VIBCL|nr:Uncharacterised protein [Vibrio cholerae]CSA72944.1 Uncharacterised protein [Vibrio cholerae]CSB66152.1 Uncharacterised protein [Vibrio cholerae]
MINARRKFSSIKPPKIKPSRRGASGKFARRRAIAPIATRIITYTSMVLNDTKYTPVMEKNRIIGSSTVRGTASSLEMYGINGKLRISSTMLPTYIEMITDQKISGCSTNRRGPG